MCAIENQYSGPGVWQQCYSGQLPRGRPVLGGNDINGEALFVGRAVQEGDTIPGKVVPSHGVCYVAYGGAEHGHRDYQVLTNPSGKDMVWVPAANGEVPYGAIEGGEQSDGQVLYIGRAYHSGSMVLGKVHPGHNTLYVSFDGHEVPIRHYEVLPYGQTDSRQFWLSVGEEITAKQTNKMSLQLWTHLKTLYPTLISRRLATKSTPDQWLLVLRYGSWGRPITSTTTATGRRLSTLIAGHQWRAIGPALTAASGGQSPVQLPVRRWLNTGEFRRLSAKSRNRDGMLYATAFVLIVLGGTYAAVPIYRIYCQATGKGGKAFIDEEKNKKIAEMVPKQ
ncbi:unnamed protein product, partial [Medioppia subpectinata]